DEHQNLLCSIEKSSEHPLADAIVHHLKSDSSFIENIAVENISGQGIKSRFDKKVYFVGNPNLITNNGIVISETIQTEIDHRLNKAQTVVLFTDETQILAIIAITDKIKESSRRAIDALHRSEERRVGKESDASK